MSCSALAQLGQRFGAAPQGSKFGVAALSTGCGDGVNCLARPRGACKPRFAELAKKVRELAA